MILPFTNEASKGWTTRCRHLVIINMQFHFFSSWRIINFARRQILSSLLTDASVASLAQAEKLRLWKLDIHKNQSTSSPFNRETGFVTSDHANHTIRLLCYPRRMYRNYLKKLLNVCDFSQTFASNGLARLRHKSNNSSPSNKTHIHYMHISIICNNS